MSHRIIISSAATAEGSVAVNVEFAPPHDMSEKDVGKKVTQLLKQVKKMQEVPPVSPPHEHPEE